MAFVDLEKVFDRVPRRGGRWENLLWRSGLCNWCRGCMQMRGAVSVLVRGTVKSLKWRCVHQASLLSPLLFIIVLEALSWEFRSGVPWEDLYADDLVIIAELLEECVRRLLTWKEAMEKKGLRVNAVKTKIMICSTGLDLLQSSGKFPCAVYRTGLGSNSIFCNGCKHWVHKKCSGLKCLTKDPDYRCTRCQGTARSLDGRPQKEVQVRPGKLEVVASFCYLGDILLAAGGHNTCENCLEEVQGSATSSVFTPPLFQNTWPCVQLLCWGRNTPCQRDLALTKQNLQRLQRNDRAMIGQICNVKTLSPPGPMSYLCGLALRIWTSFWRREESDGMDMWVQSKVQSRQPLIYRLMESAWEAQDDMEAADREGLQRVEALGYQPSR